MSTDIPSSAMTFDQYTHAMLTAFSATNDACWIIGDLVNYGEENFPNDWLTVCDTAKGKSLGTLNNYARTCKRFPPHTRQHKDRVSFSCYQDAGSAFHDKDTGEATQDALDLIAQAAEEDLNRQAFRDALRERKGQPEKVEPIKTTCRVIDLITHLTQDYGLNENDVIDITAKIAELEAVA